MFRQDVEDWINGYLSERVPEHNNLPRCPYAKKSLLANKVWFETANTDAKVYSIVEHYGTTWDDDKHDAIVIHLDWNISDNERCYICDTCLHFYGMHNDIIFIEERRELNGTIYNMLLMHRFSEMQVAKRSLKRKGYYSDNT